ncbi:MAG: Lrp/AsnC ligand binding domain-containing protein [Rhodanobacteraceae bacterium]|nr:Lrp/AsnC ligand binding domain-containing protein [Rhodanobacteraceae bacterium]
MCAPLLRRNGFRAVAGAKPHALACHNLSGHYDCPLEVVGKDLENFSEFVRTWICALPGVREAPTSFSLKELKRLAHLPVESL